MNCAYFAVGISPFVLRSDYLVCSAGNLKSSLERVFKDAAVVAACPLSSLTSMGQPHKAAKQPHRGANQINTSNMITKCFVK